VLAANQSLFWVDSVLCTHLGCADEPANPMATRQIAAFTELARQFPQSLSISNSAAIQVWPTSHRH
jgi:alanine racemase